MLGVLDRLGVLSSIPALMTRAWRVGSIEEKKVDGDEVGDLWLRFLE